MKKNILLILLFTLFPSIVYADSYYANVYVKNNGDVEVHEATVKDGTYDKLHRELLFGYDNDREIYSSKNIVLTRICASDKDDPLENVGTCFAKVNSAKEGNNYVYVEDRQNDRIVYDLYSSNDKKSAFYMEYTFKEAFVGYSDINEALVTLFAKEDTTEFDKMEIKVFYLDNTINGSWTNGPIWVTEKDNDTYKEFTIKDFSKDEVLEVRLATSKENLVATKAREGERKRSIFLDQDEIAIRRIANQELANFKKVARITSIVAGALASSLYVIGLVILVVKRYFSKDKGVSAEFNDEYFTEFPSNDSPAAIEYLFNHNVSLNSFKASILYIIYKKGLLVNMLEDDFELTLNDDMLVEPLTNNEISLRDFLLNNYGNGRSFKLYNIDKAVKKDKPVKILTRYFKLWSYREINNPKNNIRKRFYENSSSSIFNIIYCIAPLFVGLTGFAFKPLFTIMLLGLLSIPVLLYLCLSIRRTKEGNELYSKWGALRLFMEDIVTYEDKLPEKRLWGKYLAYANVFGQGKMIASNIIERMGDEYISVYGIDANDYILLVDMLNNVFEVK